MFGWALTVVEALQFGIDLGGTKIEGAILDPSGAIQFRERVATEADGGYEHILARITTLYERMCQSAASVPHSLGIGTPGSVSPVSGALRNANTVSLNGRLFVRDLSARLGRSFRIENDANCFALAEAQLGAGRGHHVVFGVIMGTGCGGGIVIDGRVHTGRNAIGAEWGHSILDASGLACFCGHSGCVETFISGSGLERRWLARSGEDRSAHEILALDTVRARAFVAEFHQHFGRALANLINVLDPDIVVLGGGLSNVDSLYTEGVAAIRREVFSDSFTTPIVRNTLGDSAGVVGAARLGASS